MIAIETNAAPMTTIAGAATDGAEVGPAIRSAWLAPGFYLAFLFGALFLVAIGILLLWRSAKAQAIPGTCWQNTRFAVVGAISVADDLMPWHHPGVSCRLHGPRRVNRSLSLRTSSSTARIRNERHRTAQPRQRW